MNNIILIQTRMHSSRFKGKCMAEIDNKPLTYYTVMAGIETRNSLITGIIYPERDNEVFHKYFNDICFCYAGSEENVLNRYYNATLEIESMLDIKVDNIVRLTSDCPFLYFFSSMIDYSILKHVKYKNDYTHNRSENGVVSGFDIEIFTRDSLEKAYNQAMLKDELEHVTLYFKNNPSLFKIGNISIKEYEFEELKTKFSVDTREEFEKIEDIFKIIKYLNGGK